MRGLPLLEELCRHPDAQIRMQAVWTLGELRGGVGAPGLSRSALDAAPSVRWQAAWSRAKGMGG